MSDQKRGRELRVLDRDEMLQARRHLQSPDGIESVTGRFLSAKDRFAIASALAYIHEAFRDLPAAEFLRLLEQVTATCLDEALVRMFAPTIVVSGKEYTIDYDESCGHWTATIWMDRADEFNNQLSVDPNHEDVVLMRRSGFFTLHVVLAITNEGRRHKSIDLKTGQLRRQVS